MKKEVEPVAYVFDDDPIIIQTVSEILDELTLQVEGDDHAQIPQPKIEVGQSDEACYDLINGYVKGQRLPFFIVDLNIDGPESGIEIVRALRRRRSLRYAPAIVLTSHWEKDLVDKCYELGANSYVVKSDDPDQLEARLRLLLKFWFLNICHSRVLGAKYDEVYFNMAGRLEVV